LLKTNGKEDEFRWQLAICGIERFLNDLGFKMEEKIGLFKWLSAEFAMEFNVDKSMRKNLSNRYRELKYVIDMIITPDEQSNYLSEFNQFFEDRSSGIKSLKIKDITNELTASFIHMHLNRMFRSKQRFHEMIIYDLLHRHYVSLSAKKHYLAAAE
jgi:thiopeptide-type bacteriocin biosynthesis protein